MIAESGDDPGLGYIPTYPPLTQGCEADVEDNASDSEDEAVIRHRREIDSYKCKTRDLEAYKHASEIFEYSQNFIPNIYGQQHNRTTYIRQKTDGSNMKRILVSCELAADRAGYSAYLRLGWQDRTDLYSIVYEEARKAFLRRIPKDDETWFWNGSVNVRLRFLDFLTRHVEQYAHEVMLHVMVMRCTSRNKAYKNYRGLTQHLNRNVACGTYSRGAVTRQRRQPAVALCLPINDEVVLADAGAPADIASPSSVQPVDAVRVPGLVGLTNDDGPGDVDKDMDHDQGDFDLECDPISEQPDNDSVNHPAVTFDLNAPPGGTSPREWIQSWIEWSSAERGVATGHLPDYLLLLRKLLQDPSYLPGWNHISKAEVSEFSLMQMLNQKKDCSLDTFDAMVTWAQTTLIDKDRPCGVPAGVAGLLRGRKAVLDSAKSFAGTEDMSPVTKAIFLKGCGQWVRVTSNDYAANIYNILTTPEVTNNDTLLLNGPTPYDNPPKIPAEEFDDFDTGSRYRDAWLNLKQEEIDFPLGDVLFIDKSVCDLNDRLSGEPINHTTALIKRCARNRPNAWRSMGHIPNFKLLGHADAGDGKMQDYHFCLQHLLAGMCELQTSYQGILWPLQYNGVLYMVRFRPYILACLGDTPGQNMLAGKMGGAKCDKKCRYCDVGHQELSNPDAEYGLITQGIVDHFKTNKDLLSAYNYKGIDNAFHSLRFGETRLDPFNVHNNLPAEILHALQKGTLQRTTNSLIATRALNTSDQNAGVKEMRTRVEIEKGLNKANASPTNTKTRASKTVSEATKRLNDGKNYVFGGVRGRQVDAISLVLGKVLVHQSDRDLPRLHFSKGIRTTTKMTAAEQQGLAFLWLVVLCSTWAVAEGAIMKTMGDAKLGGYVMVLEALLCLEELMKSHPGKVGSPLRRSDLPAVTLYLKYVMEKLKETAERTEGDGYNLVKFHLLLHMVPEDILKYGSPANISGGPGECQFKDNLKLPGSTTQKRASVFDQQVCIRRYEHLTTHRCMERITRAGLNGDVTAKYKNSNPLATSLDHNESFFDSDIPPLPPHFGAVFRALEAKSSMAQSQIESAAEKGKAALPSKNMSGGSYRMQWVFDPCRLRPNYQKRVEIVYIGGTNTEAAGGVFRKDIFQSASSRSKKKRRGMDPDEKAPEGPSLEEQHSLRNLDGTRAGLAFSDGLAEVNDAFRDVHTFFAPMFEEDETLQIELYTTLKIYDGVKQEDTYRADPYCYVGRGPRNDWTLLNFGKAHGLIPVQILIYVKFDHVQASRYNQTIASKSMDVHGTRIEPIPGAGRYALVESLKKGIKALTDPSIIELDAAKDIMQANSHLMFYGEKELSAKGRVPLGRLVDIDSFSRPVVVIRDFSPTFQKKVDNKIIIKEWVPSKDRTYSYTIVRPRSDWHRVFIALAKSHFKKAPTGEKRAARSQCDRGPPLLSVTGAAKGLALFVLERERKKELMEERKRAKALKQAEEEEVKGEKESDMDDAFENGDSTQAEGDDESSVEAMECESDSVSDVIVEGGGRTKATNDRDERRAKRSVNI